MNTSPFSFSSASSLRSRAFLVSALLALSATCLLLLNTAHAAALESGRFVEVDGWKARITIDCLLKDKLCGSFRYETQGCEGDLIYSGESAGGFEFRAELKAGRCLPGCTVQVSSDFKRYAEICKNSRHEGTLIPADGNATQTAPASGGVSAPATVVIAPPAIASARNEEPPAATAPPPAGQAPAGTAATAESGSKGYAASGEVHIKWDDGNSYDGNMANGKRNGKGLFKWANGQSYNGDWRDDSPEGEGSMVFANGDRYQGQVKSGVPDGRGKKQFSNGDSYEGQISKGLPDGEGTYTEKSGNSYSGQWKAGIKTGQGKYAWVGGQSYAGDWVADKPEGRGSIRFANGDQYDGQISNGLPQGKGVKTYASSQDRYEGEFVKGEAQGEGLYRWKNGDLYAGSWKSGKKSGQGRYTWTNGDYWEGDFADDKQTDSGRLFFTPTIAASSAEVEKVAKQTTAVAEANAGKVQAGRAGDKSIDHAKLLAIPMVAKELRDCTRKEGTDCATTVVNGVLNDTLFPHKWQTMATEKDAKGKGSVFEVDANSQLEAGNVYSWLRSGDGALARNIGVKYGCRAQTLEIQLVYNCQQQGCALDVNIDKYAGKVIPATDIKNWFKGACER
ncbi:hypothetical protein VVD49_13980 [Uliginosibacterium sp. H3]|uniref:MORN repeat-containing protein n=1 Tax=Uliginosibacterium silvisoli TaxID=3114758 RepID=A0ABU6K5D1_9RHOO|nr:hypothetical protein [Uliginosibacterium sp. H3]